MAITDENTSTGMVMPVQPMGYNNGNYGYPVYAIPYGNNGGFGDGFGNDWLILFLFAMMFGGGWGMGGFGGFGGFGGWGGLGYEGMFPWLLASNANSDNLVQGGFNQAATNGTLAGIQSSITSGFGDVQTALCGGFAGVNQNISNGTATIQNSLCNGFNGVNASINNAQSALTQQMYANQIADLERSFASQTANTAALNSVNMGLQNCCCENRAATADLKYTVATENCADRAALSDGIRDILAATQAQTQAILDRMCQDKIDEKNDQIAQLRQEVLYARGQASQDVHTARILAGQVAETDAIYSRLSTCPVPTTPVYGRTPIFTCNNGGCGCSGGFAN